MNNTNTKIQVRVIMLTEALEVTSKCFLEQVRLIAPLTKSYNF